MELSIEVPDSKGFMESFWGIFRDNKKPYEERIKNLLESYARDNHRYKSRTGNLKRATRAKLDLGYSTDSTRKSISLYVDTDKAPYAKYVINRSGKWGGDPFIENTLADNNAEVLRIIHELYTETINQWNNS